MHNAEKRVAIVTGGSRGIGLGISRALADKGRKLAIVYHQGVEHAEKAKNELSAKTEVLLVRADVGIKAEAERAVGEVLSKWGRADILVNNAGVFAYRTLAEMDEAFFEEIHRTNLLSAIFMSQSALPAMKKNRFGRIINASSISGRLADIGLVAYGCSKAGVDIFTRIAAGELGPWGITVNAYAPGIIATDMTAGIIATRSAEKLASIPLDRFGDIMDAGHLVAFLASDEAGYISGEIIGVDGGMCKVQSTIKAGD
ncbi:MAG: SDR family oxidoreductase [Planctomycetota bacterium]|jgi:3-oxoacyl-[acyl-carrier protein] reductase|nr:SDR family oxidoreductase [Planctomycetota bacterium]